VIQVLVNVNALQGGLVLYVTRPVLLHTMEMVVQRYATVKMEDCVIIKQEFVSVQQDILALSMYITGNTIYRETCLNRTSLGPTFVFWCSADTG
jgi:hypothetical protein